MGFGIFNNNNVETPRRASFTLWKQNNQQTQSSNINLGTRINSHVLFVTNSKCGNEYKAIILHKILEKLDYHI